MDVDEFIAFLLAQGYAESEARALVDHVFSDDFADDFDDFEEPDHLDIRDRNGQVVAIEIDYSMSERGVLRFIVRGQPAAERPSRQADLLKAAADALDDGQDPLAGPFLSTHDITYDELQDLAGWLAIGARLTAWAMENPRQAAIAARAGTDFMKLDTITQLLRKLNETAPGPAGGTQ